MHLQTIVIKNKLFGKFIKCTNSIIKEKLHKNYKGYRNMISALLNQSKKITMTSILEIISTT